MAGSEAKSRQSVPSESIKDAEFTASTELQEAAAKHQVRTLPSPFKLTRVRDLPAHANEDTVTIRDILGQVLLKEVWLFDFLFDVDWVM